MSKVTRIAYSKYLNSGKYERLQEIAHHLGVLRSEVWQRYGSIAGVGVTHREIRDQWLKDGREFDVPARLWKETLRDAIDDIHMCREAMKVKVRKAIRYHAKDDVNRKRLYTALRYDRWLDNSYLRRMMRKYWKHGHTDVRNQIMLDTGCYTAFGHGGQAWIAVMSLEHSNRIAIPLNTNRQPSGTLRLILRDDRVEVHYAVDAEINCSTRPSGDKAIGVDKGYTEAFTDSDGDVHGAGLGKILSAESDYNKRKYQRRNKLRAIAEAKPHKRGRIVRNNLGSKKLNRRKRKHKARLRDIAFGAAHSVVDKASTVVSEDLTSPISGRSFGKNQNRRLSIWVKGLLAEAITSATTRRSSVHCIVNAAYTSQTDSRYGVLLGHRQGDRFYCFDGVVLGADMNAARNILARVDDPDIRLYTSYKNVKRILQERTEQTKRLGLLNQDTSCNDRAPVSLSTVSELPLTKFEQVERNRCWMIPFCKVKLDSGEIPAVVETLESGWIGKGPRVAEFEKALAEYVGVEASHVVALNSCTSALFLSLKSLNVGPGDEVITTPLTFCATAHVIEHTGARTIFADVNPVTWNISPWSIKSVLSQSTRAVVPVDLYGLPCAMAEIRMAVGEYWQVAVVEDAAHALGATVGNKMVGTLGNEMTALSMYPTKNVASPDGGVVVCRHIWHADAIRKLSSFGLTTDAWSRVSQEQYTEPGVTSLGYKAYWNDVAASIALVQLNTYPERLKRRRVIAHRFLEVLAEFDVRAQRDDPGHVWHLVTFRLGDGFPDNMTVIRRLRDAGLGAAFKYRPLHLEPYYQKKYSLRPDDFPIATDLASRLVNISPSPALTDDEVDRACEILRKVLQNAEQD